MSVQSKAVIGRNTRISFVKHSVGVPAKIDTGADSSAVWASNIRVGKDGLLRFSLFGEGSPYYNGKIFKRKDFTVARVRSASGHDHIRYFTHLTIYLAGRRMRVLFGLSDRSVHSFPVLIGRRTLQGKFVVDVGHGEVDVSPSGKTQRLKRELRRDPHKFHQKYHGQTS